MAVVAFTAVLALQIPRKALFFRPKAPHPVEAFAAFVEFDAATYATVMQQVRMSWQMRAEGTGTLSESPLAILDLVETPPEPAPLALAPDFFTPYRAAPAARARVPLKPPTLALAREEKVLAPPEEGDEARRLRERLLALPPSVLTAEAAAERQWQVQNPIARSPRARRGLLHVNPKEREEK